MMGTPCEVPLPKTVMIITKFFGKNNIKYKEFVIFADYFV